MPDLLRPDMTPAAIILCGGRSSRMGQSKALLDWKGKTLIERLIEKLTGKTSQIVVVSAREQILPPLSDAFVIEDDDPFPGPLTAFRQGLCALENHGDFCLLLSCDLPLFETRLISLLLGAIGKTDFAMPVIGGHFQHLCAVYRVNAVRAVIDSLPKSSGKMGQLRESLKGVFLDEKTCSEVDPQLGSFQPCNTPEGYEKILRYKNL